MRSEQIVRPVNYLLRAINLVTELIMQCPVCGGAYRMPDENELETLTEELPSEPQQLYRWSKEDVVYVLDRIEALVDKVIDKSTRAAETVVDEADLEVPQPEREPEPPEQKRMRRVV